MTQVGKEVRHEAGWSLPGASLQRAHSEGPVLPKDTGEQEVQMRPQSRGGRIHHKVPWALVKDARLWSLGFPGSPVLGEFPVKSQIIQKPV